MNNFHSIGGIKMNKNIDFVNGNTKKCLLEMTVPMIIAMFLNMAYNLVDSLWIGNLLGEQAYAALTNSDTYYFNLNFNWYGSDKRVSHSIVTGNWCEK